MIVTQRPVFAAVHVSQLSGPTSLDARPPISAPPGSVEIWASALFSCDVGHTRHVWQQEDVPLHAYGTCFGAFQGRPRNMPHYFDSLVTPNCLDFCPKTIPVTDLFLRHPGQSRTRSAVLFKRRTFLVTAVQLHIMLLRRAMFKNLYRCELQRRCIVFHSNEYSNGAPPV